MRCCVPSCINATRTNKTKEVTFHLYPKDLGLRAAWLEATGTSDFALEHSAICSEHFLKDDLILTKTGAKRVKHGVIPFLVNESSADLDLPAISNVCRICLAMDTRLIDMREQNIDEYYKQITGMYMHNDTLPQRACWECVARLHSAVALREKAARSYALLQTFNAQSYITIRDIKTLSRAKNRLTTNLVQKIYENDDFDLNIKDGDETIKSESTSNSFNYDIDNESSYNDTAFNNDTGFDNDNSLGVETSYSDNGDNVIGEVAGNKVIEEDKDVTVTVTEIKDENEIFVNEFDEFESDDDKTLSTFSTQMYTESLKKERGKVKKRKKVKKVKEKVKKAKEVKEVKEKIENGKKRDIEADPELAMDKYKTSDIKRRKPNDGLDESLFTITTPTYEEQIAEVEKRQEMSSYKNAMFKCTTCYRGFQIRDRYDAHIVRHSEKCGMYECFICKTRLKAARALRKHITAQHTEQFSCKGCPFITRNRGVAREHGKWHAGTKYQCPHCAMEFDKLTTYMGHIRIKHASDWVCPHCGYTFVSRKGVMVHKRKKHRLIDDNTPLEGPTCEVCDVQFANEEAYARHLKLSSRHMTESDPNRLRNDSQSMNSEHNGRVMRRIERRQLVHARSEPDDAAARPVSCEQCGVVLRDLRLYAQHFRRAHPDKNRTKYPAMKTPAMCELCGRIFQSMALLKDHMWVHTGEKRFKCAGCPKSFTQKSNLVFHERVHSEPRPSYPCALCGKHFAFYNNRRRHMFIHTGLKPFKCTTCGKNFTTAGEQRAHLDHVHMKKPWPKRARKDYDRCTEP